MGGGSKKKTAAGTTTVNTVQPTMATFGNTINPSILGQLQQGGLLDAVQPTGYYAPVNVPIIKTPNDVAAYLQSIGQTPVSVNSSSSGSSSSGSSSSTSTNGTHKNKRFV